MTESSSAPAVKMARHMPDIDGYRITGVLGQGGMGIVYRAQQVKLNRTVALKVLPGMVATANPAAVSRFRREATSAARLHHTNIIPIYDFGEARDGYYYAMELIAGQPLHSLIRWFSEQQAVSASPARLAELIESGVRGPSDAAPPTLPAMVPGSSDTMSTSSFGSRRRAYYQQVARWMADAADALHYAHSQGIVHRDIKPANLILSTDGRIMVADFGLAKAVGDESYTMTGSFVGTLRYVSPEQAMSKRVRIDHRTDVYSLGITMYELLCFQPAFPGEDEKEVFGAIIARDPVHPRKINHAVPPELETICLKCVEKLPDARYNSARELAEDLKRFINDMPIAARRPSLVRRVRKFVSRHRAAVAIASGASVLLLVVIPLAAVFHQQRNLEWNRRLAADHVARAAHEEGRQNWTVAARLYEQALRHDPHNIEALGNFARMRKEQYNLTPDASRTLVAEGLSYCDRAIAREADSSKLAGLWNTRGVLLKILDRPEEAIAAYQKAVELSPHFGAAWENLGIIQAIVGKLEEAAANILRAAELASTTESGCEYPWHNLAAVEFQRGRPDALARLDLALACNRSAPATSRLRARIMLKAGSEQAAAAFQEALYADRNSPYPDPLVKRLLALAHLRLKQLPEAVRASTEAIELMDMPTPNYLVLAIAEAGLGHLETAGTHLQSAEMNWPEALSRPGVFTAVAPGGVLWFESSTDFHELHDEARSLIGRPPR